MKIIRPLLTLIGTLTIIGLLASAVLFLFAPKLLTNEDQLTEADAIVVLGGQYYRPLYAAELYKDGYAPRLLVSKPVIMPEEQAVRQLGVNYLYQWEVMRDILKIKGVPDDKVSFFGEANISTYEEAKELKKALPADVKSIIVVTSSMHTRRAGAIFRKILPKRIKISVVSNPYEVVPAHWWKNFRTAPFVLLEIAKTIYFEFGGSFVSSEQLNS